MYHKNTLVGDQHIVQQWEAADLAARTALSVGAGDVGKVCYQVDTKKFYILEDTTPTWGLLNSQSDTTSDIASALATLPALYQPLDAQLTSVAGLSYVGNALKVVRVNATEDGFEIGTAPSAGATYTVADAAPTPLSNGEKWLNSINGVEYTWVIDGDTSQWAELGTAGRLPGMRELLSADRTYYVSPSGNDSNNGLGSGAAFLTIQKALDTLAILDIGAKAVTIQLADGTYTTGGTFRGLVGGVLVTIQGNAGTPANVLISTTGAPCLLSSVAGQGLIVKDLKMATTTSGSCLAASGGGIITFSNVEFGASAGVHIAAQSYARVSCAGNYKISGSAPGHILVNGYGYFICAGKTITLTGTPNFSSYFIYMNTPGGAEHYSCTFTGAATGSRYYIALNAACFTNGAGASYFPGSVAGTTASGGQYA